MKTFTPEKSLLIANAKLEKAERDIATLRRLVDYTVAIIVAAGGRVAVPTDKLEEWSEREWRHESDGETHVFSTLDQIAGDNGSAA
jgi:predicted trehalose synthase